jgi:hypothetical protein
MKADQWAGLVTKASPYILPPGAAVEQVNLALTVPGQLTTRDGMRKVVCTESASDVLDCFPYDYNGTTVLLALTASGELVALPSPAYGPETPAPSEPPLTLTSSQTGTTYTQRFIVGQVAETAPPAPPASDYVGELFGGRSSTTSWPRLLTGNANWRGDWDIDGDYFRDDVVRSSGWLWIWIQQDSGNDQPFDQVNSPWLLYRNDSATPDEVTYFGGSSSTPDYPDSVLASGLPLA